MIRRLELFGLDFQAGLSVEEISDDVMNRSECDPGRIPLLITPNVDQIVKLSRRDQLSLKQELSKSQWILPDGQPIIAVSKIKYGKAGLPARLTGSDFFPVVWKRILNTNARVLFIVPQLILGEKFKEEHSSSLFYSPPYFDLNDNEQVQTILREIKELCSREAFDFVFIGLGFPKQEILAFSIFEHLTEHNKPFPKIFLLGASFEFYFGLKKRAPVFWQKLGIEFVHRLLTEPKRMAKRYLVDDVAFLRIAWNELRK